MANLIRFTDPFADISGLHSQLDTMVNNFFGSSMTEPAIMHPAIDIYTEDDKRLVAEVQAPGFTKDDIEVNIHNGVLELKGEKRSTQESSDSKRSYMVRESRSSFYRSIVLPKHADTESIAADFEDGVLKVTVPFKDLPQPKRIQIGAGKK